MSKRDDTLDVAIAVQGGLSLVRHGAYLMRSSSHEQAKELSAAHNALNDAAAALERFIKLRNDAL